MKKFNYFINPTKLANLEEKKEIKKIIASHIKYKKFNLKEKIIFSYPYLFFSIILFILIGWLMLWYRSKIWLAYNQRNNSGEIPIKIYKKIFESQYSNVEVNELETFDLDIVKSNKGPGVPFDAVISQNNFGPVFKIDNVSLKTLWVNWKWVTNDSSIPHYYKKIYLYSEKVQKKFSNLDLVIKKSHVFSKKGHDLENDEFNRKFWYHYNNGISARIFFPVSSQERWVEVNKNKKPYNSLNGFQILLKNGKYLFGKKEVYKSRYGFLWCKRVVNTKQAFINGMYKNIIGDIKEISSSLRLALINKYFFS